MISSLVSSNPCKMADLLKNARPQRGFTLLEVVLTLAMSVVLMMLIGGAIRFYGRDMDLRNMDVRQTQLAAAIMQMIENDLRATVHPVPVDMGPMEELLSSLEGAQDDQEDLSAAGIENLDGTDGFGTSLASNEATAESLTLQTNSTILTTPGLIGDTTQIQIDLSRLPRLEEYTQWIDQNAADYADVPSDLKTVAYFVQASGSSYGVQDRLNSVSSNPGGGVGSGTSEWDHGGLIRRSLDRSATVYAATRGGLTKLSQTGDLIAPEVVSIEFSYWNGVSWLPAWSSDEYSELPLAVQIRLTMKDLVSPSPEATRTFRHTVGLLMAKVTDPTQSDAEASTEDVQ